MPHPRKNRGRIQNENLARALRCFGRTHSKQCLENVETSAIQVPCAEAFQVKDQNAARRRRLEFCRAVQDRLETALEMEVPPIPQIISVYREYVCGPQHGYPPDFDRLAISGEAVPPARKVGKHAAYAGILDLWLPVRVCSVLQRLALKNALGESVERMLSAVVDDLLHEGGRRVDVELSRTASRAVQRLGRVGRTHAHTRTGILPTALNRAQAS